MRCSESTGRCSFSRGSQHWHQSPPQRGPTQGKVCSRTPSRSPSRHALPLPSQPCPHHRDKWLHHPFSSLYLQPHELEPLEEGVDLNQPEITPAHTTRCSSSTQESMVECLLRSTMQKHVQFDIADELGDTPQLPTDLAGFLEWPEDATDEWGDIQALLPLWLHTLLYDLRHMFQRGRVTGSTLLLLGKPDPSQAPFHSLGLQLPGEPDPNVTPHQTQCNGQMTGSGHTPWG